MSKSEVNEGAARGQKIRSETGPDREKPIAGVNARESLTGRSMGGGPSDISHSISDGAVKKR